MNRFIFLSLLLIALLCSACVAQTSKNPPKDYDECVAAGNTVRDSAPQVCVTKDGLEFAKSVKSFEECVASGYPIMKTYPPGCVGPDGKVFIDSTAANIGEPMMMPVAHAVIGSLCENKCGDGECAEMVCMAQGCPCPETKESCPQDCKE